MSKLNLNPLVNISVGVITEYDCVHPLLIIDVGDSTADTSSQLALDHSPPPTEVMDIVPSSQLTSGMFDSCVCTHNCTLVHYLYASLGAHIFHLNDSCRISWC